MRLQSAITNFVSMVRPLGVGRFRPPLGFPIETTKAAQGYKSLHRRSYAHNSPDFPIDYYWENRYNGFWAQKISAVWDWLLTGAPA